MSESTEAVSDELLKLQELIVRQNNLLGAQQELIAFQSTIIVGAIHLVQSVSEKAAVKISVDSSPVES